MDAAVGRLIKGSRTAGLRAGGWTAVAMCALLAACAVQPPAVGSAQTELLQRWGAPTSHYALPEGQTRLEYATGPYGRTTWMVDVDAGGRILGARQVLNEAEFLALQTQIARGLDRDGLLRWIGRPGERKHGGYQGGEVWSWRYPTNDCLWFQVSVTTEGQVHSGAYSIDPACDAPANGRD